MLESDERNLIENRAWPLLFSGYELLRQHIQSRVHAHHRRLPILLHFADDMVELVQEGVQLQARFHDLVWQGRVFDTRHREFGVNGQSVYCRNDFMSPLETLSG